MKNLLKKIFSVQNEEYYTEIRFLNKKFRHIKGKKLINEFREQKKILDKLRLVLNNGINKEKISYEMEKFRETGISKNIKEGEAKIIVSLTSFPERMYDVHYAVYSLLNQIKKPDILILYLAEDEFPNREADLPPKLLRLKENGLTIKWCKNLKSYKKLIPALREYPEDIIVTADDDVYYPKDWLYKLYESYLENPECIHCHRAHKITFENDEIKPYKHWNMCIDDNSTGFINFFTGAGGILYPPKLLHGNVLDEELFLKLAPNADDIWFYSMAVLNNAKIKIVNKPYNNIRLVNPMRDIGAYEETTLCLEGNSDGGNDIQLNNVFEHYPEIKKRILDNKEEQFNSKNYWEKRYLNSGNSGAGSYGRLADFKAEIINNFVQKYDINSIIEFGCGDGNQLKKFNFKNYTGFDVSETILNKCRKEFKDKAFIFKNVKDYEEQTADLVLSLDVIYHLIEDDIFKEYMKNLFKAAKKYVIIYSSNKNENQCTHVRHRKFTDWIEINQKGWFLKETVKNRYKYSKDDENNTSFADFYIFQKKD